MTRNPLTNIVAERAPDDARRPPVDPAPHARIDDLVLDCGEAVVVMDDARGCGAGERKPAGPVAEEESEDYRARFAERAVSAHVVGERRGGNQRFPLRVGSRPG